MAYEKRKPNTEYTAAAAGFLIVCARALPKPDMARLIVAECRIDGELVAAVSAVDNKQAGIHSPTAGSISLPVHAHSRYRVDKSGGGELEIRWAAV